MKDLANSSIAKPVRIAVSRESAERLAPGGLEVNVIFTDPRCTVVALQAAVSLARNLCACIRVRAPIAVPYALPLDKPPVPVSFMERLLSDLVCRMEPATVEFSIHVYLCRDRLETLSRVLKPNSLVVIGGRKLSFLTEENRMAKSLRAKGHRVVFIGVKNGAKSNLR